MLTPPNERQGPQVAFVGEESHEDQTVEIEALDQDPIVVGSQKVEEHSDNHLAAHLTERRNTKIQNLSVEEPMPD